MISLMVLALANPGLVAAQGVDVDAGVNAVVGASLDDVVNARVDAPSLSVRLDARDHAKMKGAILGRVDVFDEKFPLRPASGNIDEQSRASAALRIDSEVFASLVPSPMRDEVLTRVIQLRSEWVTRFDALQ